MMFTSIDKALVALIMAGVFIVNQYTGKHINVSEQTLNSIFVILTPILVYLIPNKPKV